MKRILVIGATSGIGRALVEAARARGYEAVAAGRRTALLKEIGGETLELDATALFNAGFGQRSETPDWALTEQTLRLNVLAFERVAQWALTHCETFAATASVAGLRGLERTNGYSASKAYMINAMEGYRRLARHGGFPCRYVTLLPGFVDTEMGRASNFWKCSTSEAAFCILKALERGWSVAYVTPRWRWIGVLMRLMPRALFERIPLG